MFLKREPEENERYCPYDGITYSEVPGFVQGHGCPVCKSTTPQHLPILKTQQLEKIHSEVEKV